MDVLPVLDLKGGLVVRGVAGRRDEYRPVQSILVDGADPLEVARAFRRAFGMNHVYVADLDAIAGAPPSIAIYESLQRDGFHLWIDSGIRQEQDADPLTEARADTVVVGLETIDGPRVLADLCKKYSQRIVFSLDLKDGLPLGDVSKWKAGDALSIAREAFVVGVRRILILDLAKVGVGEGSGTLELCRTLLAEFPLCQISTGGGIKHRADLVQLHDCGVDFVLIASALHDGRITAADLELDSR